VYRRHTNFAMESIENPFNGLADRGVVFGNEHCGGLAVCVHEAQGSPPNPCFSGVGEPWRDSWGVLT